MTVPSSPRHVVRSRIAGGAVVAIVLVVVSACGASPATGAATNPTRPSLAASAGAAPARPTPQAATAAPLGAACNLVTAAEATTATGQTMALSGDAGTVCTFSATADASIVLAVQVFNDRPGMALELSVEGSSDHLAGLGDDAFWNQTLGTVFVRKGDRAFTVVLPSLGNLTTTPAALKEKMVTLATTSLSRF